jgi:hypothetical protein
LIVARTKLITDGAEMVVSCHASYVIERDAVKAGCLAAMSLEIFPSDHQRSFVAHPVENLIEELPTVKAEHGFPGGANDPCAKIVLRTDVFPDADAATSLRSCSTLRLTISNGVRHPNLPEKPSPPGH